MRKPYPIKVFKDGDERIQMVGNQVEIFGKLMDIHRAEKLAFWLFNAVQYVNESEVVRD